MCQEEFLLFIWQEGRDFPIAIASLGRAGSCSILFVLQYWMSIFCALVISVPPIGTARLYLVLANDLVIRIFGDEGAASFIWVSTPARATEGNRILSFFCDGHDLE